MLCFLANKLLVVSLAETVFIFEIVFDDELKMLSLTLVSLVAILLRSVAIRCVSD